MTGLPDHQLYAMVPWRHHNVILGIVMVFDTGPRGTVRCGLAWSSEATRGWRWVTEDGLLSSGIIPLGSDGSFDSHICFAARPIFVHGQHWLYYMGGNGPHDGARNSSLGLATLRPDGFAGLAADADPVEERTVPLLVSGDQLILTADILAAGGYVRLGVDNDADVGPDACVSVSRNVTDHAMQYRHGAHLAGLVGTKVTLRIMLRHALVYTIGFAEYPLK
jgi:hypothetical protein